MKKTISLLLCFALLFGLAVPAFADEDSIITGEVYYGASVDFLGSGDPCRTFCYSDDYFTHSGYQYDHELAKMTMDMVGSADASKEVGWAESNKNFIDLMQKCGFENIDANYYVTSGSTPDSIGVNMAMKQLGDYTLLAVALRGHNYGCEWGGNFTVGRTGDHQGFATARDVALDYIREYITAYGVTGKIKVWLTGYSRSAITANLVGGAIDQGFDFGEGVCFDRNDLYCYTFEAPQGTADAGCRDEIYCNIHNIINVNDLVPLVSLSAWGHSRYGIDYRLPCRQYDSAYYYQLKKSAGEIIQNTPYMTLGGIPLNVIDDFHYLSLDPLTTLKKQNVTQIEFYQELINVMLEVLAPSRDYYVDNVQNDLREFGSTVMGGTKSMPAVLQLFAKKFLALSNLTELYKNLRSDNKRAYENAIKLVEELFMESMREAGHSSYNSEQVKSMVHNMTVIFLKLFKTSPDTVLTLLVNILPILNAHFPEMGRIWLDVTPAEFFLAQGRTVSFETHTHEIDPEQYCPAQPATCCETGTVEYYGCTDPDCTALLDADGCELSETEIPIDPEAHSYSADWSFDENGHWRDALCGHDSRTDTGAHTDEDGNGLCDVCGYTTGAGDGTDGGEAEGTDDSYCVELTVETHIIHSLVLNLPLSCTYKLIPELTGAEVERIQYSLDGGWQWFYGNWFNIPNYDYSFQVRILDSTGTWTCFIVENGCEVVKLINK